MNSKRKFEFLPHPADVKFRARGDSLEEAFAACAGALASLLTGEAKVAPLIRKTISISSLSLHSLLYDFMEEFIFLLDTEAFVMSDIGHLDIIRGDEFRLECGLSGDSIRNYPLHGSVKAATYNDMRIEESGRGVEITMVLDV